MKTPKNDYLLKNAETNKPKIKLSVYVELVGKRVNIVIEISNENSEILRDKRITGKDP